MRVWLLILFGSISTAFAQTNAPIAGAFGFKLGEILDVNNKHFLAVSTNTYLFTLKHPFRQFDQYTLGLTRARQIASIGCNHTFTNFAGFESEQRALSKMFIDKYGRPSNDESPEANSLSDLEFIQQGREISIIAKYPKIDIVWSDFKLAKIMLKEMKHSLP